MGAKGECKGTLPEWGHELATIDPSRSILKTEELSSCRSGPLGVVGTATGATIADRIIR